MNGRRKSRRGDCVIRYKIYMNNGEIFNVPNDEPIDLEEIAKARWMEIRIPYSPTESKKAFLNIAQNNRIEVIEVKE